MCLALKTVKHTTAVRPLIHIQKSLLISVSDLPFTNYSFQKQFVVSFLITEPLYRAYSCIKPFLSGAFLCPTWCFTYFKAVFPTRVYFLNPSGSPRHHKDVVHEGDSVQGQSKGEVPPALVTSVRLPVGNCTLNLLVCVGKIQGKRVSSVQRAFSKHFFPTSVPQRRALVIQYLKCQHRK